MFSSYRQIELDNNNNDNAQSPQQQRLTEQT